MSINIVSETNMESIYKNHATAEIAIMDNCATMICVATTPVYIVAMLLAIQLISDI